jgi:uncharacterized protein (DUF1810 family)
MGGVSDQGVEAGMADLSRFVAAQAPVYDQILAELRRGRKESHWMWFVFPQLAGLGRSPTARFYAIESIEEARRYRAHDLLGPRLVECTEAVLVHRDVGAEAIVGSIDAMKLRSSMTLFEAAAGASGPFGAALDALFGGARDGATIGLLRRDGAAG